MKLEKHLSALVSEGIKASKRLISILNLSLLVKDNGLEDGVMTIEELRSGIESRATELRGIDHTILMRALKLLEQKGKLAIFKGSSTDDEGVKFSV
ncbi:hypothetical protein GH714_027160 [Hevea brasiliensis]|uniref:Uncharacterized protein n=1 Tax=Hevea brasiliensis TaxID=3981 RepID=A0A6A6NJI4_HEVBR|nr:hypothetical protein GH714_027160 [Hevea brasiliensis]